MEEKVRQRQAQFELREWTLGQILDHTISRFPDNEALVYADRDFRQTWREFGEIVDRFAKGLIYGLLDLVADGQAGFDMRNDLFLQG